MIKPIFVKNQIYDHGRQKVIEWLSIVLVNKSRMIYLIWLLMLTTAKKKNLETSGGNEMGFKLEFKWFATIYAFTK